MRNLLIACLLMLNFVGIKAQNNTQNTADTILIDTILDEEINGNLDSLLNLWYVQQSIDSNNLVTGIESDSIGLADYPDSFYIKRLQNINSLIELPYNNIVKNFIRAYTQRKRENLRTKTRKG